METSGQNLILLTNAFPYGNWEPYLETEVKYYDAFDEIHICSLQIRKEQVNSIRELPSSKFSVCPILKASGYKYLLYAFVALTDRNLYEETNRLIQQGRFSLSRLAKLFIYVSRSHYEARRILRYLKKKELYNSNKKGIIYSYRFEYQPYVGLLIQKHLSGFKILARGHGYDLYEERSNVSYIPMREVLMQRLDKVIMIADDGQKYLEKKYPKYKDKVIVSRLGTADYGVKEVEAPNNGIRLVSCSNIVPVKRIDLIIKSLQQINDVELYWTHYGSGVLMDEMVQLCRDTLGNNIHYEFRGQVSNAELMEEYKKQTYHLFLNVSSSEGIPVSIMEAMSFGIPCIATDVGGTKEIVKDGENGMLLEADFLPEKLTDCIRRFMSMSEDKYKVFRHNARSYWENKYSSDKNYRDFSEELMQICYSLPSCRSRN